MLLNTLVLSEILKIVLLVQDSFQDHKLHLVVMSIYFDVKLSQIWQGGTFLILLLCPLDVTLSFFKELRVLTQLDILDSSCISQFQP